MMLKTKMFVNLIIEFWVWLFNGSQSFEKF